MFIFQYSNYLTTDLRKMNVQLQNVINFSNCEPLYILHTWLINGIGKRNQIIEVSVIVVLESTPFSLG